MSSDINMDELVKELKTKGNFISKDDVKEPKGFTPEQFMEHMKSCSNPKCGMHEFVEDTNKENWMRGFSYGRAFGMRFKD